jgi:hypothetical protein
VVRRQSNPQDAPQHGAKHKAELTATPTTVHSTRFDRARSTGSPNPRDRSPLWPGTFIRVRLLTPICELLGIEMPIVQAPVSSAPGLATAVSNAGALGTLQRSWLGLEEARAVTRKTRRLTARSFGVKLVLVWSHRDRLTLAIEERVSAVSLFWGDPSPHLDEIREGRARLVTAWSTMEARQAAEQEQADLGRRKELG